jgi:hypothetical protein
MSVLRLRASAIIVGNLLVPFIQADLLGASGM